ncbi:MAG: DUF368 domain-containing protein [Bacilli bacterium]|nr:DUF368 domain-containing protein [Bacilli bacterium]
MSYFIIGLLIGIITLIPGISGGTILLIFNMYDDVTYKINNIYKNKILNYKYLKDIIILVIGLILGILLFSKIIEYLFLKVPSETIIFFLGIIIFSVPKIKGNNYKFNLSYILLGVLIILLLNLFNFNNDVVITEFPKITPMFLLYFCLMGSIDGIATIIPGVSGSLIMMILGPYFLLKSYLANFSFSFAIPLFIYYLGDLIGILLGSKIYQYLIKRNEVKITNLIIGLVLMSSIILIPSDLIFDFKNILKYLILIISSYIITTFITNKKY